MKKINFFKEKRIFQKDEKVVCADLFSIRNMQLDENLLNCFLKLGYIPGHHTLFKGVKCLGLEGRVEKLSTTLDSIPYLDHDFNTLKDILIRAVESFFNGSLTHVVPLSGGMDSRIILAALCELTSASNIHTYTFGVPGAYDYDIPNRIAGALGTKHKNFSAHDTKYSIEGLIRAAKASDGNTEVFHPLVLNRVVDHYGPDAIYWSGFAGDLVGGGFGDKFSAGDNPKQNLIDYEKRGIYFLDDVISDEALFPYISSGEKMTDYVSANEACFWENHVERYTGHHIFRNDMVIQAPLIDVNFLKFFFTLSNSQREKKMFFNKAFSSLFPDVFSFPTKDYGYQYSKYRFLQALHKAKFYISATGWRLAPSFFTHPNSAYIDMSHAINERSDVKSCVDELISDLSQRNIIDNDRMFFFLKEHRGRKKNYTKDIINLASLEVILKASEQ